MNKVRNKRGKKILWVRERFGSIWKETNGRGGNIWRGCERENEKAKYVEKCVEFEKKIDRKIKNWETMTKDRLLESIKKNNRDIEEKEDKGEKRP